MYTMIIQVGEDDYDVYVSELDAHGFEWVRISDFTPIGRWCLVKVIADSYMELDLAELLLG